jgi:hypothetical protein
MQEQGFSNALAAVFAAIGSAESGLDLSVINDTPGTGDYSVGVFQVNYFGSLYPSRTAAFGTPQQLILGGISAQSRAAKIVWDEQGFGAWSTYNNGEYAQFLHGYSPPSGGSGGGTAEPAVREGDSGPAVQLLQEDLNALGDHLAEDGIFGPATLAAVLHYQATAGLTADGIVGPLTWARLIAQVSALPPPVASQPPPSGGSVPPSEPPGNIDPDTVQEWSNLVSATGPELGNQLVTLAGWGRSIGGIP